MYVLNVPRVTLNEDSGDGRAIRGRKIDNGLVARWHVCVLDTRIIWRIPDEVSTRFVFRDVPNVGNVIPISFRIALAGLICVKRFEDLQV